MPVSGKRWEFDCWCIIDCFHAFLSHTSWLDQRGALFGWWSLQETCFWGLAYMQMALISPIILKDFRTWICIHYHLREIVCSLENEWQVWVVIVYAVAVVSRWRHEGVLCSSSEVPRASDHRRHHQPQATKLSTSRRRRCIVGIVTVAYNTP